MRTMLGPQLNGVQRAAGIAGAVGLVLCAIAAFAGNRQFIFSYLFGCIFWLELSLGCLVVAMIHYLTAGRWGNVARRFFEAGYMTLPVMALLFVPIFFGLKKLYPWARTAEVMADKTLQSKAAYLNPTGFILRAVVAFAIWISLACFFRRWSLQQDTTADTAPTRRMRTLSGPGVVIYTLTVTFAFIDWVMSLEPDWYSTMFPIIICGGQILLAYATATLVLARLKNFSPVAEHVSMTQFHQLGNLLLTFVIFWAYVVFGQFLINWAGNTPKEIIWYQHRIAGDWKWIIAVLVIFHFFLPFFLLLFRRSKRNVRSLAILAGIIFAAHVVAVFWFIAPAAHPHGFYVSWLDAAAFFGVGGVWIALFIALLKRHPLIALHDPRLEFTAIAA